jgi:RDD family
MRYASWPRRAASILIDYGILIPLPLIALLMSSGRVIAILYAVDVLLLLGNRWALAGYNGRTLGRTVMRIKLVGAKSHQPIGFVAAFTRDLCHTIDSIALGLGWIRPLWRRTHQTIADSMMKSIVVPE